MFDVIAFDADDTLWHNEHIFLIAQEKFSEIFEQMDIFQTEDEEENIEENQENDQNNQQSADSNNETNEKEDQNEIN